MRTCNNCGIELTRWAQKKYCSLSCAAQVNNVGVNRKSGKKKGASKPCTYCGKNPIKHGASKYCSQACQHAARHQALDTKVFASGNVHPHYRSPSSIKKFLLRHNPHECSICGIAMWNGQSVPLVMDHKDGNHKNDKLDNLRLVCGNCDMQLPTYKNRNNGNGRHSRRRRYAEGKSY